MPYRRRTFRRRRPNTYRRRRRSTPWYNKKYSVAQMASSAIKGVSYLKGLVNAELKKYDQGLTVTPSWSGGIFPLTDVAQGDSDSSRNGNSILTRYYNINGQVNHRDTTGGPTIFKIMMFIDTQQRPDTSPTVVDILENTSSVYSPFSKLNSESVGRYSILMSRIYNLNNERPSALIKLSKNMRHHVRFNGINGTDYQKGTVYLLMISNKAATFEPQVILTSRMSYYDN